MLSYSLVNVADASIIDPSVALPDAIAGLDDASIADLSWVGEPLATIFAGKGYWPLISDDPVFDPATQTLDAPIAYVSDPVARVVRSARTVRALTEDEMAPRREARKAAVMTRRDVAIDAGMTFDGKRFQTRAGDRENISGASILAFMATSRGAQPGDFHWNGGTDPFAWIAEDNSIVPMDAPTVMAFGAAAAARKQACIFHAYELKIAIDAASDPSSIDIDAGWPA